MIPAAFAQPRGGLRDPVTLARVLMIALVLALLFSPPLVNLFEGLLFAVALVSRDIRSRLAVVAREPMVAAAVALALLIALAATYSIAPPEDAWQAVIGWRKILLLPLGAALFDDSAWKARVVHWLVGTVLICMVASFVSWGLGIHLYKLDLGIAIRNHATQGIMFAVTSFCIVILLREGWHSMDRRLRLLMLAGLAGLLLNIALVTPGRSGYVVLLVLAAALPMTWTRAPLGLRQLLLAGALFVTVCAALAIIPATRDRIMQGVHEMETYQQSTQLTSMGIRVVMLQHTLTLLETRPLRGYGTGSFKTAYHELVKDKQGWQAVDVADPHNQYLKIWVEQGIGGLLLLFAILVAAPFRRVPQPYRALGLAVTAAWCATSLTSSHFSTFSEGRFILAWMGIMLALNYTGRHSRPM